jgi:ferritin-like metal-binding protein YciE
MTISNLHDALTYLMKGLYDAEKKLQRAIPPCSRNITADSLRVAVDAYYESSTDKLLKLDRVFNYLMTEPTGRKNEVMEKMIEDTHDLLKCATTDEMRDVILTSCIQNINYYKISGYRTAMVFALELGLDPVVELINDILTWEREASLKFTSFAINDTNQRVN